MSIVKVAKIAGVSHTTVANVINRRPGVSHEIIDRVEAAIKEAGYKPRPPHKRRGPRSKIRTVGGRTGNVAVLFIGMSKSLISGGIFTPMIHGVENALGINDMATVFVEAMDPDNLPSVISLNRIDGLIIAGMYPNAQTLKKLKHFPCVYVLGTLPKGPMTGDHVTPDDNVVGWLAADYFLQRGHKDICCLVPQYKHPAFTKRSVSFEAALGQAGVNVSVISAESQAERNGLIEQGGWDKDTIDLVDKVLASSPRPTGLFIPSDYHAAIAQRHIRQSGVRLGRDVEVVGCNNEFSVLHGLEPRPATIDIRAEEIGRRAVELLLGRLGDSSDRPFVHIMVEPRLIEGQASKRYKWNGSGSVSS